MKISNKKISAFALMLFLLICSNGNVMLQAASILFFGSIILLTNGINRNKNINTFYIALLFLSFFQILLFFRDDYSVNYLINSLLITGMWFLAFLAHNFIAQSIKICSLSALKKLINYLFFINAAMVVVQYIGICIEAKTPFPFAIQYYGMSTGDYLKGIFSNSSVNMVIMAFYAAYYFFEKEFKKAFIAVTVAVFTTYMSGIILALGVIALYGFFKFSFKNKMKFFVVVIIGFVIFYYISPDNIKYVRAVLTEKVNSKDDPARKLVSFEQTAKNFVSSPSSFIFGEGGGKFSSRTAYLTGGEYVAWFPKNLVYRSEKFAKNHFTLWNNKALSIAFRDGTANQPFSFYNKIIGEYGTIGLLLFLLYLSYFYKWFKLLTYGKLIFPLLLGFFLLDYWFEYFTVILFFEMFMFLDIKRGQTASEEYLLESEKTG